MPATTPPPPLVTSALGLGVEAFVAVRAAHLAGISEARASFELSLRAPSADWGFFVLAGLEPLIDALEKLRLRPEELEWLQSMGVIDAPTRRRLADARFACDIDAAPEGTVVFPGEAVISVEGPYWQAQLVGGFVQAAMTEATLVATRFARMVLASGGADVFEDGSATAHRLGGVPTLARAAYIGGARATSSALAARRYGLPVVATQPRDLDVALASEDRAIRVWLGSCGGDGVLRLDPTRVATTLPRLVTHVRDRRDGGDHNIAIELPAGDRLGLARTVAKAFSSAGLTPPPLLVSGDVGERDALELRSARTHVTAFAIAADATPGSSALSSYDLVSIDEGGSWSPRIRVGADPGSSSDPGRKLLVRYVDARGRSVADVAHAMNERMLRPGGGKYVDRATGFAGKLSASTSAPLRAWVMRAGKRTEAAESPDVLRERATTGVAALDEAHRHLVAPARYPVGFTQALASLKADLLARATDV